MQKLFRTASTRAEFSDAIDFFIQLAGFGLVLLYTRYLSPLEFGVLALLYVTVRVAHTVVVQGMTSAVARAWTRHVESHGAEKRSAVSTAFWYAFGSSTLVFGTFALVAAPISRQLLEGGQWADVVRWFAVAGILRATQNVPRQILRMRRTHLRTGALELADFVVAGALNIYFVVIADMGLQGIAAAEVIREAIFLLVTLACVRTEVGFAFSPAELRALLQNGLPKVPRGLSYLVASASDRFFLVYYATMTHLGLYAFAYRFAELLDLGTRPLTRGLPELHRLGRERPDQGRALVGRFVTYFVAWIGVLGMAIVVFTKPLLEMVAPIEYLPVVAVVPWLVLALCLGATHRVMLLGVQIQHSPRVVPRVMSIAAVVNLACNFWWIPRHGIWGAAVATTITHATLVGVAFVLDRRHFGVRLEFGRLARILATVIITYGISVWATPENLIGQIAAGLAVVLLYPALLGVFGFYTDDELGRLRELVNHRVSLRTGSAESNAGTSPPSPPTVAAAEGTTEATTAQRPASQPEQYLQPR